MNTTHDEIEKLLVIGESDHIEFTESTTDTDKFSQAVCAFANDFPNHKQAGYLLIGVKNNAQLCGLTITDAILVNLAGLKSNGNIQPLPALTVEKLSFSTGDIAVVKVMPSDLPPVRYKGQIWIRTGPRKSIANEQEERMLTERRIARAHTFDVSSIPEATIDDISLNLFDSYRRQVIASEVIEANHRSLEEQLAALRLYDSKNHTLNVSGILLFGKNPRFFLPGAYIQYLKLPTQNLTDAPPEDQAEISGDLMSVLRELDLRIKSTIRHTLEKTSVLSEKMMSDYPEVAIRELIMNAIVHRNYQSNTPIHFYWFSDRIEIQSPGGLYGEVTRETLTSRNSYRNPVIAEAMKGLGYVNRYGYGIQLAKEALKKNGNPDLEFSLTDDKVFLVIIRQRAK